MAKLYPFLIKKIINKIFTDYFRYKNPSFLLKDQQTKNDNKKNK